LQEVVGPTEQQDGREGPGNGGDVEHADHALTTGIWVSAGRSPALFGTAPGTAWLGLFPVQL
jgi:hypothetical protein